jgi:fucose permease
MGTFLLVIIYLSFISLGLPDSLLGVAWPVMQSDIKVPLEYAGFISMTISGGTIISSFVSGTVINRLGTGKVTFISCLMTASALLGFSIAPSFVWLIVLSIPLGLGAGSVDAALNHYVATHYKAHHMSWLHCFWGVGVTTSPLIMSGFISANSWRGGYITVSIFQFVLATILFLSLPIWNRAAKEDKSSVNQNLNDDTESQYINESDHNVKPLQIKGVKLALVSFLFYCGAEATMGLWGSSFLIHIKGMSAAVASQWVSLYFGGITVGRFLTGFFTMKISNKIIIRTGQILALVGTVFLILPFSAIFTLMGFILVGLGFAPIYPCMIHETPKRFGKEHSQKIIGYQMAFAYVGTTFLPPLLGFIASLSTIMLLPFFVMFYIGIMLFGTEKINKKIAYSIQ